MPILNFEFSIGPSSIRIDSRTIRGEIQAHHRRRKSATKASRSTSWARDVPLLCTLDFADPKVVIRDNPIASRSRRGTSAS